MRMSENHPVEIDFLLLLDSNETYEFFFLDLGIIQNRVQSSLVKFRVQGNGDEGNIIRQSYMTPSSSNYTKPENVLSES